MPGLSLLNGAQAWGNRPGTGPFGFLFSDGQLSDVIGALLYWHGTALAAVVGVAFLAQLFEKRRAHA
jgi:hypothetical protein